MNRVEDIRGLVSDSKAIFSEAIGNRRYNVDDDYMLAVGKGLYNAVYSQIHGYLDYLPDGKGEPEIRKHIEFISDIVLPFYRSKIQAVAKTISRIKKERYSDSRENREKQYLSIYKQYCVLYEDLFALSAYRNLENFALYMEWGMEDKDKVWKYNLNCFKGFWYYANKMVLDGSVKYLEKQCPTGFGKTFADTVLMAYIFGVDINADILKVVGNPSLVTDITNKIVKYMCKPNYAKVFPYYEQFEGDNSKMFDVCRAGGNNQPARLLIHGSIKGTSLLLVNKDTPVDGGRFKYRFYDDVTRSKDKGNIKMHEKDCAMYNDQWKKRKYDDNNNFEIFSGTTYHIYDFLSTIKRKYGGEEAKQSKINKYTKYNAKFRSVFVSVPKLDWETDESTYPHKYSTEEARADRLADYNTFMAMDMQSPMPIEGCPFSYDNIQCYDTIPHIEEREEECCWAMLDPARTGANYVSMAICLPIDGKHYLKDCIFVLQPMDRVYSKIVSKIEQHHITHLHIEKNTDTSLKALLEKELHEKGIYYCNITEIYTYKKKESKIYDNEELIRTRMVFPKFELYAQGSEMGKFMRYFTSFSYTEKNEYDDSVDSIAMYVEKFIGNEKTKNTIHIIKRKK